MKQLFHIQNKGANALQNNILLIEISDEYCCLLNCNGDEGIITELQYYTYSRFDFEQHTASLFAGINWAHYSKVVVCSVFPEALLTPKKLYSSESNNLLQTLYNITVCQILFDEIPIWQMVNAYAVPQQLYQQVINHYPGAQFIHVYTTMLNSFNRFSDDSELSVHFTSANFRLKVKRGRQLLLVQTFTFQSPMDVVYALLKVCTELGLSTSETNVILSGLIDEDSALYKEMQHYFLNLQFAELPKYPLTQHLYPQHFFTSLYNLVACVL